MTVQLCSLFYVKFLRQDRGTYRYFFSFTKELYEWSIFFFLAINLLIFAIRKSAKLHEMSIVKKIELFEKLVGMIAS